MHEGNLGEAVRQSQKAIDTFKTRNELQQHTAIGYHQLSRAYEEAQQGEASESAYRQSAAIQESLGNLKGAANIWGQLAINSQIWGNFDSAENWYRKALKNYRQSNNSIDIARILNNLADLLLGQTYRLVEAQQLAEEALAIKQNLDPVATDIWLTYQILAEIASQQGRTEDARAYDRQKRQSYNAFPSAQHHLQRYADFIAGVVAVTQTPDTRQQIEASLTAWEQKGLETLVTAIRQLLNGERDEDTLCNSLDCGESTIICAILRDLGAPSSMPAVDPLQQLHQSPAAQVLIEQLAEGTEGQALLQAIKSGDEEALEQFLSLLKSLEGNS
jgi:tetratricopeptide (TPR) repeat protein